MEDLKALTECAECTWDYIDRLRMALASACKDRDGLKKRLSAYEDTGLEPEEIRWMGDLRAMKREIIFGVTAERLKELACADKAGRLVVLPVKTKETVYVVGEKRIMECFIAEAYIDDARGLEYMVSFDCDDDCDGCPFNSWRQDYSSEYSCDGAFGEGCVLGSGYGKTFFSTREAAEAALKGGESDA